MSVFPPGDALSPALLSSEPFIDWFKVYDNTTGSQCLTHRSWLYSCWKNRLLGRLQVI